MTFDISNQSAGSLGPARAEYQTENYIFVFHLGILHQPPLQTDNFISFHRSDLPRKLIQKYRPAGTPLSLGGGRMTGPVHDSKILVVRPGNVLRQFFLENQLKWTPGAESEFMGQMIKYKYYRLYFREYLEYSGRNHHNFISPSPRERIICSLRHEICISKYYQHQHSASVAWPQFLVIAPSVLCVQVEGRGRQLQSFEYENTHGL